MARNINKKERKKNILAFLILALVLIASFIISIFVGRYNMSLSDENSLHVLMYIRLPRIIVAMIVGASLSIAGVSYQGMFKNPMAAPDILGASSGAGFGASLMILLGGGYLLTTFSSFLFGLFAVLLAFFVSKITRKIEPLLAMILAGVMISSFFSAGTSFVKLVADTNEKLPSITYWLMGSLSSVKLNDLYFILIPFVIGIIPLLLLSYRMNLLSFSDDEAKSMGVNVTSLRVVVIICATLLTASSVAISGMIGFVGLVIPYFCRLIFGNDFRKLLPSSILLGASFLLIVDDIARVITTAELPIGILTSFVGAPIFIILLIKGGDKR